MGGQHAGQYNPAEGCVACALCQPWRDNRDRPQSRHNVVWGQGPAAPLMLIGEAPGYYEDVTGRPFVGKSGQHLDELLLRAGLQRSAVYTTNSVKCRPPNNRDPLPREVEACGDWLAYEIAVVQPLVVVTLGKHSSRLAFPHEGKVVPVGTARRCEIHGTPVVALATYHPAFALRDKTGAIDQMIVRDLKRARRIVQEIQERDSHE